MRSIYLEDINIAQGTSEIDVSSSQLHHLQKVVRVKEGDNLLILNGLGDKFFGRVNFIKKKSIIFEFLKKETSDREFDIDLALLMPKKEAFEQVIQNAIQLGISKIYTFSSQYSQIDFKECGERLKNLIISSYQQSNNSHKLKIFPTENFTELAKLKDEYDALIYFSSREGTNSLSESKLGKILYLIGPEGGLSEEEESMLDQLGFTFINLPSPILRTPVAVAVGAGFIISKITSA